MKLKKVPGEYFAPCNGCVFNHPMGCTKPHETVCEFDGDIFVVDEEASPEEQQNETKPRFNPEWGCQMKTLKTILSFPQAIISVTLAHVFMLTADLLAVLTRGAYGIGDFFQTEAENAAKVMGEEE